jgi:tetratricopeptide (TPR) repeat protein
MKLFLSYAQTDGQHYANRLSVDLKNYGLEPSEDRCGAISGEEHFNEQTQIAIDQCDAFIMLLTPESVRFNSFCMRELVYSLAHEKPIIVAMVLDCTIPVQLTTYNWLDFRNDYAGTFALLADALLRKDLDFLLIDTKSGSTSFDNYLIEGNNVAIFYQQEKNQVRLLHVAPRIVGYGGYLFGRAAIFEECIGSLHSGLTETIVLQGMGGIGKSSLAAGLAWGLISYFSGGTIWLNAENATLIDLCDRIGRAYEDEQMVHIAERERPIYARKLLNREKTLVVLDNVNSRHLVQIFQEECHPFNLIVTTRDRFARLGHLVELDVLADDPAVALFRSISTADSKHNQDIQKLVRLLGGHPQALAIAATLCVEEDLTPAELTNMLASASKRIQILRLNSGTKDNIWATFDASYQSLNTNEKEVLRTLGGSWSKGATEELLGHVIEIEKEELSSALRSLVRHALISSTRTHAIRMYHLHDLIYVYAQSRAQQEAGNLISLQQRWLQGTVTYAQQYTDEDNVEHYNHLEVELENLLGATNWATDQKIWRDVDQIALALCAQSDMMSKRGYSRESVHLLEQALLAVRELGIRQHEALHLGMLGSTYVDLSDFARAAELLKQAVPISQEVGDQVSASKWTGMIGNAYGDMGLSDQAIEYLSKAIDMARMQNDKVMEGFWLGWRGNVYRDIEAYDQAKEDLLEAITVLESVNHTLGATMWRGNYARTLARSGNPAAGLAYCKDNPAIADQLGNPRLKSWALLFVSECLRGVGRKIEAYSSAFEGLDIMRKIADLDGLAEILHDLGAWYLEDNDLSNARLYLEEAQTLRKSMSHGDLPKTEAFLRELQLKERKLAQSLRRKRKISKKNQE